MKMVEKYLPEGPKYFPDDMVTDQPERNIVQEIVREKLLTRTRDEVPHAIGVFTEEFHERENGKVYIRCTIYVERDSQKRIIIGKKGTVLKEQEEAREEIQSLIGAPVLPRPLGQGQQGLEEQGLYPKGAWGTRNTGSSW